MGTSRGPEMPDSIVVRQFRTAHDHDTTQGQRNLAGKFKSKAAAPPSHREVCDVLTLRAYDTARDTIVRIEFEDVRDQMPDWENDDNIVGAKILYA